ncbi:MAG: DUF6493 family protein, partial [Mucilaginibacter sp.]
MTITEQLTRIIETIQENELIPFLKSLDDKQRKALGPGLKKLQKDYSKFLNIDGTSSYSDSWSARQNMLAAAAFVCFNLKEFDQGSSWSIINRDDLNKILPWYCPGWLTEYAMNRANSFTRATFDYRWYMELVDQGYVQETELLTALALKESIFEKVEKSYSLRYAPGLLAEREITLKEHIWTLFKFEIDLNNADRYNSFVDGSTPDRWVKTFIKYTAEGKIDRARLLKECLIAATGNFNQALSNWFVGLFESIEPTKTELLNLADEFLNTFNSTNSKPLNTALNYFKELVAEPAFPVDAFLGHTPTVLTSETKSAVTSALMILEKIAKIYSDRAEEICMIACQAFIHHDEKIQVRAAKLLQKYGNTSSAQIIDTLSVYSDSLLLEAKSLLKDFAAQLDNAPQAEAEDLPATIASQLKPVTYPQTFDDFVFLASQAFEQNETYHFDMLPAAILHFQDEMTEANIAKLLPAFQRAYKMVTNEWSGRMGYLDNMLARFFMDYGELLVKFYPTEAQPVKEMRASFVTLEAERKAEWDNYRIKIGAIKAWGIFTHSLGYKPHKHILLNAIFMLERKIKLPLLSTPTHEPCYVSSLVLVQRLIMYQEARITPGDMDFEVAVARCVKMNIKETLELTNEKLKGERRYIISFIFGGDYSPMDSYKSKTTWLVAALVHNPNTMDKRWFNYSKLSAEYLRAEFTWKSGKKEYFFDKWDADQRKNVKTSVTRSVLEIDFGQPEKQVSAVKKMFKKLIPGEDDATLSIYDYTELKYEYLTAEHNDIKRLLTINPADTELLLAHVVNKCLRDPHYWGENDKRFIIYTLETLLTFAAPHRDIAHLVIATCMISSDKTARTYAAELWIQGVTLNTINSETIGKIIGTHERVELAPLKRFTDLVLASMCQISAKHNEQLAVMLGACILNMDEPINNTKKLLDIYAEVLSVNKNKNPGAEMLSKLNLWQQSGSLEKSVQKIKKL